jgi:hypothetical protein
MRTTALATMHVSFNNATAGVIAPCPSSRTAQHVRFGRTWCTARRQQKSIPCATWINSLGSHSTAGSPATSWTTEDWSGHGGSSQRIGQETECLTLPDIYAALHAHFSSSHSVLSFLNPGQRVNHMSKSVSASRAAAFSDLGLMSTGNSFGNLSAWSASLSSDAERFTALTSLYRRGIRP